MNKTLIALIGSLALSAGFAPAAEAVESVVVNYSDLDIATPAGVAALYRRLGHAAKIVCPYYPAGDVRHIRIWRNCYNTALADAVARVDFPPMTAQHQHRN